MSFLDTPATKSQQGLTTTVFTKSTNSGDCLNYESICPERYKLSIIGGFLHWAYTIFSTRELLNTEKERIKQTLDKNNLSTKLIDKIVNGFLQKKCQSQASSIHASNSDLDLTHNSEAHAASEDGTLMPYYRNQVCHDYKISERRMRKIIYRVLLPTHHDTKLKLSFYYKNKQL